MPDDSSRAVDLNIPACTGRAFTVSAGDRFRVIDLEGSQVADLFCYLATDPSEHLSPAHTRVARSRLFPRVGDAFETNRRRPILRLLRDDSPGVHDMLCAACSAERYQLLGAKGPHPSCEDNLRTALADHSIANPMISQPVNLFEANPIGPDGTLGIETAPTKAGDSITFLALADVLACVTACPQDMTPLCGWEPTAIGVQIGSVRRTV